MIFNKLAIAGAYVIEPDRAVDARGHFARTWCVEAFAERGLCTTWAQSSVSFNRTKGTLRGMHWQADPHGEIKLVRCSHGHVFDVMLDVRRDSPTYGQWYGTELSQANGRQFYIPRGVAHGFITLADDCELTYQISTAYYAASARGVRYDDPAVGIDWPLAATVLSERDLAFPSLDEITHDTTRAPARGTLLEV